MRKIILTIVLWLCFISAYGQVAVPDTIYIYETVTVYDTIVIRDTVRIKRLTDMPRISPKNIELVHENNKIPTIESALNAQTPDSNISLPPAATFSENSIIYKNDVKKSNHQKEIKEMKLNILNYTSAAILTVHAFSGISAQEINREEPLPTMPVQLTVAYPITTMGERTKDYCFNASFNLFYGTVGAINGIEYGIFMNNVEREMRGAQFAGIGNRTREVNGVQSADIFNMASTVKGAQFGGIANMTQDVNGVQFGGIANLTGNIKGVQFGGIANLSEDVDRGVQFAGITNISRNVNGVQFGGIANVAENVEGTQFAGIGNVSRKVTGSQFAGIFNRTETLRGFQLAGIVNVTDTIESGISMALINIVKKGFYRAWELSFADYQNVGVSFKMGTQKFYTIFTAGANFMEDQLWVAGLGFGNRTALGHRVDFQPEIVSYNYFPNNFKHVRSTWSNHLKLGFVFNLNDRLGLVVAPGIYYFYAEDDENGAYYRTSSIAPFYKKHKEERQHEIVGEKFSIPSHFWGFGAGISVGLVLK